MCENCSERGTLCPNCGADPCYHLCVNSPHYYSPEQELFDAMMDDGSDDRRERYANETIGLEDENYSHHCEGCGREDSHLPEGCGCRNGAALPSMTIGAVIEHKDTGFSEADHYPWTIAMPIHRPIDDNEDVPF